MIITKTLTFSFAERFFLLLALLIMMTFPAKISATLNSKEKAAYTYSRLGNKNDAKVIPQSGFALMGGGSDQDEAFIWLIKQAAYGDIVVLRASGTDAYNSYLYSLGPVNSIQTIVFHDRKAAYDSFVLEQIRQAEGIFFAGGDQAKYFSYWNNTPLEREINAAIERGAVIGGTSAGLAIQGENFYTAEIDSVVSSQVLANPLCEAITLAPGMLKPGVLKNVITDTHFANRDRMGRLLVFLSRLQHSRICQSPTGLGIDEATALLIDANGQAQLVGKGNAYILNPAAANKNMHLKKPLDYRGIEVFKIVPKDRFFFNKPHQSSLKRYYLSVIHGKIYSHGNDGKHY